MLSAFWVILVSKTNPFFLMIILLMVRICLGQCNSMLCLK